MDKTFSDFHDATALAGDLVAKLEAIRTNVVRERSLSMRDLEDLLMADVTAQSVLRMLLRLTRSTANAEAAALPLAAE